MHRILHSILTHSDVVIQEALFQDHAISYRIKLAKKLFVFYSTLLALRQKQITSCYDDSEDFIKNCMFMLVQILLLDNYSKWFS